MNQNGNGFRLPWIDAMEKFDYKITQGHGLHARPAGKLVNVAGSFESVITIINGKKSASAKGLFALMGLGVKAGDTITVECEGVDEKSAKDAIERFLKESFSD